jgi:hypothetical protein
MCPAAEIAIINANDRCNPNGREAKACDQRFPAASAAWQNCYYGIEQCRKQVDEDNRVSYKSNEVFRRCHQRDAASSTLASRLASQQAKNATANDVRRRQDQQFSDTVREQQQQYQQRKAAREQAEQARQKQAPAAERGTVVNQGEDLPAKNESPSNEESCGVAGRYAADSKQYASGCPCQPGTYFDGEYCIDNAYRNSR